MKDMKDMNGDGEMGGGAVRGLGEVGGNLRFAAGVDDDRDGQATGGASAWRLETAATILASDRDGHATFCHAYFSD